MPNPYAPPEGSTTEEIQTGEAEEREERERERISEVPEYRWPSLLKDFVPASGIAFIPLSSAEVTSLVSFTYSRHDGRAINHHVSDKEKMIMAEVWEKGGRREGREGGKRGREETGGTMDGPSTITRQIKRR
jgi:hypothetical protein